MYPLKFEKIFKEKIWGGRKLENLLNMRLPEKTDIGESWEITCHKNGMSIVEEGNLKGRSLESLISEYKEVLVGKDIYEQFKNKFPLLIKYLDVNDRLSVQVHPSDDYALNVEGEFGKSECWYIIDASEDAKLIMGLKEGITREKFLNKVLKKDFTNMFNTIKVEKGDFIYVNPGLVHATLEGSVVICEVQQNSDTTYRIYDFDRLVEGELRPLHLEKASEVIEFGQIPEMSKEKGRDCIKIQSGIKQILIRNKYFNIDKIKVTGHYQDEKYHNFKIFSVLSGNGKIEHNGKDYFASVGDTYFIPANLEISILGNLEILKSFL